MPNYIQQLRQPQVFGGYDPNQEMMDLYQPPSMEEYNPYQDMGPDMGGYQPQPIVQPQVQQQQQGVDPTATYQRIMAAYTPETSARDRQNRLLDNYPGQYTPTTGDRWTAALVGLGERNRPNGDVLKVQNEILQGPRMRDIEDWKNQITPVGVASTNENARNIQERTLLSNAIQADTQAQRLGEQSRQADARLELGQFRAVTDRMRAEGWTFDTSGPTVIAKRTNPQTGQPEIKNTGYDTGKLNDLDRINLQNTGRIEAARVGAAGANERSVNAGAEWARDPDGNWHRINARDPNAAPPPPGSTKPEAAPPNTQGEQNKVNSAAINAHISANTFLNEYVTDNKDGTIGLKPPPTPPVTRMWTSDSESKRVWDEYYNQMQAYNQLKKMIVPSAPPEPIVGWDTPSAKRPANKPNTGTVQGEVSSDPPRGQVTPDMPTIPPTGTIRMRAPDGRIVNVPANQVAEAEKRGGRRLQ